MATTPLDTIERFFRERNRAWLTNDTASLQKFTGRRAFDSWLHRVSKEFAAKQHEMHIRGKRLLKTHTQLTVKSLTSQPNRSVQALVDEIIHFVYRDGTDYNVEWRQLAHQQHWVPTGDGYLLAEDVASAEYRPAGRDRKDAGNPGQPVALPTIEGDGELAPYPSYLRTCNTYDRVRCQRYADLWWNSHNPKFVYFTDDDCTGFASQCIYAGNVPMTDKSSRAKGWWYQAATQTQPANWSFSWSTSHALYLYLTTLLGAVVETSAKNLRIGDLIFYDWDGSGRYHHTTIVTDFDASGDPLVNAHTVPSYHRHYLYLDSPAWTADTRYAYVHMPQRVCD